MPTAPNSTLTLWLYVVSVLIGFGFALQGAPGWYMMSSGLVDRPAPSIHGPLPVCGRRLYPVCHHPSPAEATVIFAAHSLFTQ